MPSFKTDQSFLEKISLGAIGTRQVHKRLIELGHKPIELERGSMSYKIWKTIKIKRIRVPDIICVDNGVRIESRAKSKLKITMSHSLNDPQRGWDADLKDEDFVALISCEKGHISPVDWTPNSPIQFISVKQLRESYQRGEVITEKQKGVQEGSEISVTWPSCVVNKDLTIKSVTDDKIIAITATGRSISYQLTRKNKGKPISLRPLVKVGDKVAVNQIIASVVPVEYEIPKNRVDADYFIENLNNLNLSERYAAAKALRFFNEGRVISALRDTVNNENEHIYVKLEASASLAMLGESDGYSFIATTLEGQYLQNILEAVIVLNEIKSERACEMLCNLLLNEEINPEIRAGAAWGLGEQENQIGLDALVSSFNAVDENVKNEAARALAKLTKNFSSDILETFETAKPTEMPGIAWALTRSKNITFDQLTSKLKGLDSRHWVSFIIGVQGEERYISEIEKLKDKDPEVYFAVTLLWKIMTSWIYELKEY